jgi:uncharacterized metal-binding protein
MKPIQCASCFKQSCVGDGHQEKDYCPTYGHPEVFEEAKKIYAQDLETGLLAKHAAIIESKGYMVWPRLKDTIELARRMEYEKIAVLFCPDLMREAKKACRILTESGFTVVSRVCGVNKTKPQLPQALMSELNDDGPELVVNAGLCTPCETEISQFARIPMTTFIVRDKRWHNNPASAVYASEKWRDWAKEIYRDKIGLE